VTAPAPSRLSSAFDAVAVRFQLGVNGGNVKTTAALSSVSITWDGNTQLRGTSMSKKLVIGTLGMLVALGAATEAAYATNPNVPSFSPYAIMAYDAPSTPPALMSAPERRAAYLETVSAPNGTVPNGNVPSFSPYAIMPQGR
jgi:hypothetical protein